MHRKPAWGLLLCAFLMAANPAGAQQSCPTNPQALGVARTVEIDTTSAPAFGFQHKEHEFLADGEIVLTFDDGPMRAYTRAILDALSAHCTKATFFMVGRMALADPDMVKEVAARGHSVGTHTWSHANLGAAAPARARAEIELGVSAVQHALGKPITPFFRFPYLRESTATVAHLRARQLATFSIDVDSKDYRLRDPRSVHHKVMADLARARKGIILFHDIHASTARAMPALLADLKAHGYRVVHLVPRSPAKSVAEFDALAGQEAARRQVATSSQPLLKRALTWPTSGLPTQPAAATGPQAPQPPQDPPARPAQRAPAEDWLSNIWR